MLLWVQFVGEVLVSMIELGFLGSPGLQNSRSIRLQWTCTQLPARKAAMPSGEFPLSEVGKSPVLTRAEHEPFVGIVSSPFMPLPDGANRRFNTFERSIIDNM